MNRTLQTQCLVNTYSLKLADDQHWFPNIRLSCIFVTHKENIGKKVHDSLLFHNGTDKKWYDILVVCQRHQELKFGVLYLRGRQGTKIMQILFFKYIEYHHLSNYSSTVHHIMIPWYIAFSVSRGPFLHLTQDTTARPCGRGAGRLSWLKSLTEVLPSILWCCDYIGKYRPPDISRVKNIWMG